MGCYDGALQKLMVAFCLRSGLTYSINTLCRSEMKRSVHKDTTRLVAAEDRMELRISWT